MTKVAQPAIDCRLGHGLVARRVGDDDRLERGPAAEVHDEAHVGAAALGRGAQKHLLEADDVGRGGWHAGECGYLLQRHVALLVGAAGDLLERKERGAVALHEVGGAERTLAQLAQDLVDAR